MIVDSALYRKGERVQVGCEIHDYAALRAAADEPHDFVWVGLADPTQAELDDVAAAFGLHPLAVEDALNAHQRPKLEKYDDSLFLTLRTVWYVDEQDAVETGEINMFVGSDYVVTVRHGEGSELHTRRVDLEADAKVLDPRAVGGHVRRVRPGGRRLRGRRLLAAGGRRRDRVVGLLARAHQRLGPDLHPQARDRRDASRGACR